MCIVAKKRIKKGFIFLVLLFVAFYIFFDVYYTGKMLIMGWGFDIHDTSLQTNMAIDAILNYVSAAKQHMTSEERYDPSCRIELYENIFGYNRSYDEVYIYINRKSEDDYFDRYIEIDFYITQNGYADKYKLVLNFNGYKWSEDTSEKGTWELVLRNEPAYDSFISWIETLRR
jgi:uncharacterized protein (UPF0333 family)